MYCWPLWRLIVTSRLVATWCHRLECPPGWSDPLSRVSCAVSLDPGNGSLYPGGHFCPSPVNSPDYSRMTSSQPVKKTASKIDYSRLPRIAGSSLNHMIRNCPTTSQETFNDGYKKSWYHQNYLVIRGFCFIRALYNEVSLYHALRQYGMILSRFVYTSKVFFHRRNRTFNTDNATLTNCGEV